MTWSSPYHPNRSRGPHARIDPPFESPGQLALIAIIVWLVGAVIHPLAILAPLGLVLLIVAGVAYLLRPKSRTMYWRGRQIDLDDDRGPVRQLYRTLFKR
jgi:cbb3-type cytochrome oxidase subunit 3